MQVKKTKQTQIVKGKIKIRAEINKIENRQAQHKINKTKTQFFEEIKKIDKSLTGEKKEIQRNNLMRGTISTVYTDNKDLSF